MPGSHIYAACMQLNLMSKLKSLQYSNSYWSRIFDSGQFLTEFVEELLQSMYRDADKVP